MSDEHADARVLSRRTLLRGAARLGVTAAMAAVLPGCGSKAEPGGGPAAAVESPPETTTLRLPKTPITTSAAAAVALDFLQQEGFTDVQYVDIGRPEALFSKLAAGEFDMALYPAPMATLRLDAGDPIVVLGGINSGCFRIFGTEAIRSMRDFKGKTITTSGPGLPDDVFLAVTLANVGVDVRKDVTVITHSHAEAAQALASGQVDGMTALPPFSHELRAKGIGHIVLDANVDRPWSQYFFSMVTVYRPFRVNNPVATRRALRALLKSADVIAKEPERGAQAMLGLGFIGQPLYEATLAELRVIPHDVWRKYDPASTLRFYALRLREAGLIESTPEQIISQGTDFRSLRELKRELKEA